jgi:phosphoserine phosphatase RsbU/P
MSGLREVLAAFRDATRCEAAVWVLANDGSTVLEACSPGAPEPLDEHQLPGPHDAPAEVNTPKGLVVVATLPGPRRAWVAVGPCAVESFAPLHHLAYLRPIATQFLQSALEVEHAASELAERYEEINLLYTISEILGRTVSLEEAAKTILHEISETVGARRAAILVRDRASNTLNAVATIGVPLAALSPITLDDECSVSARVFRTLHPCISEEDGGCEAERPYRRGALLSVPILWTTPTGGEPLGVVNLSDRRSGQAFTAGDQKLITAIATQIGTAIQNARLVRASVEQQRLAREMQLAHDLQMRLLPRADVVAPLATVAARVVPAESVGGDFYNLVRMGSSVGVMIGDVSGHGYQAALIMALAMSASAIHAQSSPEAGDTLRALGESLREELTTTEMFISAFYAVVDRERNELSFANAGHPHAFIMRGDGTLERLAATELPIGMAEPDGRTERCRFDAKTDLLLLFTDGVSDARALRHG